MSSRKKFILSAYLSLYLNVSTAHDTNHHFYQIIIQKSHYQSINLKYQIYFK